MAITRTDWWYHAVLLWGLGSSDVGHYRLWCDVQSGLHRRTIRHRVRLSSSAPRRPFPRHFVLELLLPTLQRLLFRWCTCHSRLIYIASIVVVINTMGTNCADYSWSCSRATDWRKAPPWENTSARVLALLSTGARPATTITATTRSTSSTRPSPTEIRYVPDLTFGFDSIRKP